MRIRRRYAVLLALVAVGAIAVAGIAFAAATSTFSFKATPTTAPKDRYQKGSLFTSLKTSYTNPGNNNPGGAVERTQIYLDKYFRVNPRAAAKCSASQLANKTMKQAMTACSNALVGKGRAQATANGLFRINGCVLLFNGKPQNNKPTLLVFTRVLASNPSNITCEDPRNNRQGNATVLLTGVFKPAAGPYSKFLDVDNITQAATFPLTSYVTTVKRGNYASAKCAAPDRTWRMKTTWTYNDGTKSTKTDTQLCKVG